MERNAYFIHPVIEELQRERDSEKRKKLKQKLAVNISSLEALKSVLGEETLDIEEFYPDRQPKHPTTENTIDGFLDRFGTRGPDTLESVLEQSGSSDYFASLDAGKEKEMETEENEVDPDESDNEEQSDGVHGDLTAGFAKILIKNGNYPKALEIIREINLKNPEKSIYFADQIRFIKKLMLNEAKKQTKTT